MNDIFVRIIQMPDHINGACCLDANGDYNIYIADALSDYGRIATLQHELNHIHNRDFDIDRAESVSLDEMEREAEVG